MARVIEGEEMLEMIDLHEKWLKGDKAGKQFVSGDAKLVFPDLKSANLRGDLRKSDLRMSVLDGGGGDWGAVNYSFEGASFGGCRWSANVKNCSFAGAVLEGGVFTRSKFENCGFKGAFLSGGKLDLCIFNDCDLSGVPMNRSNIRDSVFTSCVMNKASMEGINAVGTRFLQTDLRGANLSDGGFWDVRFYASDLTGARARGTSFQGCFIRRCVVVGLDAYKANFYGASFMSNFKDCKFRECLMYAYISDPSANFTNCDFEGSKIEGKWSGVSAADCNFNRCLITRMFSRNMGFKGASFEATVFEKCEFEGSTLVGCSFRSAAFSQTSFLSCDCRRADFTGADLAGLRVTDTKFDGAKNPPVLQKLTLKI